MATYTFSQVDVFGSRSLVGNPVAVVHDATGLDDERMAELARWTNLSETTFLLPPEDPGADYRLRIFTPGEELPFAGHPTLGSAHAWLESGGAPALTDRVVQECGIGLVELRGEGDALAFRAPGFLRTGPVDEETLGRVIGALGVEPGQLVGAWWIDNGPGWLGLELDSAASVLSLRPDFGALDVDTGVIGPLDADERASTGADVEVRAFCPGMGINEDPVTGSLNAGFAVWLTDEGRLPPSYVARQGTALGRDGRVRISTDDAGDVWVGGTSRTVVRGTVDL
ncbi:PhzF family phenazine biosynthesis protein [Marmoricola sp. URHB0036]|uniref:PhzF family phenazine biosynthesis protein n=1 Tax=Marmoricola sp. URHB0036 TaxID=1298863 RepID=UPI00042361E7|nr:PhzF family phenazine biosynthesis protein [Marmoricola sp. URHB0036]